MKITVNWHGLSSAVKGCIAGCVIMLAMLYVGAQATTPSRLPADPHELIRHVVANELRSAPGVHFMYRDTKQKNDGSSVTREMIETQDGVLARVIAINGKPLTPSQREKEDKRLQRLLNDPSALAQKRREQKEDENRIRNMVAALPDAFKYEYASTPPGARGEVVLNFTPNPAYDPPSREQQVYTGMSGQMVINLPEEHLAKIDGTLFRDVNFGWGILGRLYRGGKFIVEQSDVGNGDWEPTRMVLDFTGKVFLVKSLKIQSVETTSDYRRVPELTIAQALDMLKKADGLAAEGNGAGK